MLNQNPFSLGRVRHYSTVVVKDESMFNAKRHESLLPIKKTHCSNKVNTDLKRSREGMETGPNLSEG